MVAGEPTRPMMTLVTDQPQTLREMEDQMIQQVLDKHDSDKPAAAKELGIALKTLYNRLSQMELKRDAG
jgi:transcriptional regulator with PAS, ATPase and Fis domain